MLSTSINLPKYTERLIQQRDELQELYDIYNEGRQKRMEEKAKMTEEINKIMEGTKDDQDKTRLELIPPELLFAVGDILTFGAKKYADRNWEKGMKWSRVYGALMRHMWAWWRGEKADPETGKSHLWHAGCCISFLIAYEERKVGEDDRPN